MKYKQRNGMKIFIIVITFFCKIFIIGAAPPVVLKQGSDVYSIDRNYDILEDKRGEWTIEDVKSERFVKKWNPNTRKAPNYGVTKSVYWIRLRLQNSLSIPNKVFLKIANPFLDYINVFYFVENKLEKFEESGELLPFKGRNIPNHHFVFELNLSAYQTKIIYLKIKTNGVMDLPISLLSYKAFLENTKNEYTGYFFYFGILFSLLVYNLFLYYSIRESTYFYYVLFLGSILILNASAAGFANEYLWAEYPLWGDRATNIFVAVSMCLAGLFIRSYLNTKNNFFLLDKFIIYFIWIVLFLGVVSIFFKYPTMIFLYASLIPGTIMAIVIGVLSWRKNVPASQYYLLAWLSLILGATIRVLKALGIFSSSFFTENSMVIGSILESLLFSFGLADKINQERRAKQIALSQVRDLLDNLEDKVKQRTKELNEAKMLADSANQLKDKFLSIISHDLRSPITGVINLLSAMKDSWKTMKASEIEKSLNMSYNSLSYSLDMTHKLLDLSRFEAGRIKLKYTHISLKEMVTNIEKEFLPQLLQKRIIFDIENVEDEIITVDPSLFSQIVQNVINNAIKFTPIDGKIEVKSCIEDGKVNLSIKDNGIGIPPNIMPYLFDISRKTSEIGTVGEKGHGIGLLFSNDFISFHHGEIIPSNNPDGGACFTITIPHNEKTMLLTDDSDKYRNDLANIFRNENWLVIEESNGKELLETLERIIPDVIITDKNMPELDGIKAIKKINENPDYDDILIFLLSADFSPESIIEFQENEFLSLERISGFIPRFESFEKIKETVLEKFEQNKNPLLFL